MNNLPPLINIEEYEGADYTERWNQYLEGLYKIYLETVAFGHLVFRTFSVRCQFRPATNGKHYAFWHLMQEGSVEDNRTPDLDRCRRVAWIGWVIQNADKNEQIRVFPQKRGGEKSWVLWLFEQDYAVILWERKGYYLLKTAFLLKPHKKKEFERDWSEHKRTLKG